MSCSFDKEIIQRYIDNRIDQLELVFLQEHIKYCRDCSRELNLLVQLDRELVEYFDLHFDSERFDLMLETIVGDLIDDKKKAITVLSTIKKGFTIGKNAVDASASFMRYLPGSTMIPKMVKKTAKATGRVAGYAAKSFIHQGMKRLKAT